MDSPTTNISDTTQKIVGLISQCCIDIRRQPTDLRYGDFQRWLKETWDMSPSEMRELSEYIASVGHFTTIRDAFFASTPSAGRIEAVELKSIAALGRTATATLANQELFLTTLEKRLKSVFNSTPSCKPFGYSVSKKPHAKTQRVLSLILSDLHFGTWLDPREVPYKYTTVEEARRLASVIKRTCDFKRDYRDETELVVWLGGDLIKGLIHDVSAGLSLAEQVGDAVWLLRNALVVLAGEFKKVTVHCTSGNHDRNVTRHHQRATTGKWDSFATHIYIGVKSGVAFLPNVTVNIPRTPHIEYAPFGEQRIYATHGDTCLDAGNPGKSINTTHLENQMLRINQGEAARGLKPYGLFIVGHVHTGSLSHPATGDMLTNGCLIPPDPFSVSIGYTSTKNGQYLLESTEHRLVGDSRFLEVDQSIDKDDSLDRIIKPWSGEF